MAHPSMTKEQVEAMKSKPEVAPVAGVVLLDEFEATVREDEREDSDSTNACVRVQYKRLCTFISDGSLWIPVGERQPSANGEYLTASSTGAVLILWHTDGHWHDEGPRDQYWERFVTHWMPLPEAPK